MINSGKAINMLNKWSEVATKLSNEEKLQENKKSKD